MRLHSIIVILIFSMTSLWSCTMDLKVTDLSDKNTNENIVSTIDRTLKEELETGTHPAVAWNSSETAAYDQTFSATQVYDSSIRAAADVTDWSSLSWQPLGPYLAPLPNDNTVESYYAYDNINMTGNLLLFHMDDGTGATTISDGSGYGYSAFCTSCPQAATGVFSGAMEFASGDYIEVAHQPDFLIDEGTISLWFYPTGLGQQGLISKDSSSYDTGGHLGIWYESTNPHIWTRLQSTTTSYTVTTMDDTVTPNQWNHLAYSFGPAGIKVYINGLPVAAGSYTGGLGTSSGGSGNFEPWVIGSSTGVSGNLVATPVSDPFEGKVDEVALWNRQLTDSEVESLYRRGALRLKLQVRSCEDVECQTNPPFVGPSGPGSFFSEVNRVTALGDPTVDLSSLLSPTHYLQFRLIFESDIPSDSPLVREVNINP